MTDTIAPQHHLGLRPGDVGETVLLPGDPKRTEMIAAHFDEAVLVGALREYTTRRGTYQGIPVATMSTGIGCPSTAIAVKELAKSGHATSSASAPPAGSARTSPPGALFIATAAVRGDGTSRQYVPPEFPAVADRDVVNALVEAAERRGVERVVPLAG